MGPFPVVVLAIFVFAPQVQKIEGIFGCDRKYLLREGVDFGIITSPNFPFDYSRNFRCSYDMKVEGGYSSKRNRTLCFRFHRFDIPTDNAANCTDAYLELHGGQRFCGNGQAKEDSTVLSKKTAWDTNLCFPVPFWGFFVQFKASSKRGRGFYATYKLYMDGQTPQSEADKAGGNAPCNAQTQYTCFNRKCIPRSDVCSETDHCGDGSGNDFTHARCKGKIDFTACDFEDGWCGLHDITKQSIWHMGNGTGDGPFRDHTIWWYKEGGQMLFTSFKMDQNRTVLASKNLTFHKENKDMCLSFWYKVEFAGRLSVYLKGLDPELDMPVWSREDMNFLRDWRQGEVYLPKTLPSFSQVQFEVIQPRREDDLEIGLDDISLVEGRCSGLDVSCTFELGLCGWRNAKAPASQGQWVRSPRSKLSGKAKSEEKGYYLRMSGQGTANTTALLTLRPKAFKRGSTKACLRFQYFMKDPYRSKIIIKYFTNMEEYIRKTITTSSGKWKHINVTIYYGAPMWVDLEGILLGGSKGAIGIDDVILTGSECSNLCSSSRKLICRRGYCMDSNLACDGVNDCGDNSDEGSALGCPNGINVNTGLVIGIIVGILVALVLIILVVVWIKKRQASKRQDGGGQYSQAPGNTG